jgi:asparaginyl-tRNA synthetase
MTVDYWELVGTAPPGGLDSLINPESGWDVLLDQGHATLRGKTKVRD